MKDHDPLQVLIEKYEDIRDSSDEWLERNNAQEVIDDLRELRRDLNG